MGRRSRAPQGAAVGTCTLLRRADRGGRRSPTYIAMTRHNIRVLAAALTS